MAYSINFILILTKAQDKKALILGQRIQKWLKGVNIESTIKDNQVDAGQMILSSPLPDLILVLGGDGTMLSVARQLGEYEIPFLGLNLGQVGFLTELSPDGWEKVFREILAKEFTLSPRIILDYKIVRENKLLEKGQVVNDVVIGRGGTARLVRLRLWYDQEEIGSFRADGVIVSTPVGSTAYAVAAGGVVISPELEVMEICPICPFRDELKPMILPGRQTVSVLVEQSSSDVYLTMDGQTGTALYPGDVVKISEAEKKLLFIQPVRHNYIQKLRHKGYIKSGG
ncbi:MAG TPA: NAD(+)/NADH kinase [Desulfohalobiaceae bacterium]|nr:NAD(+)/NADH kinase [Desulfohalobiaceae bacterium]